MDCTQKGPETPPHIKILETIRGILDTSMAPHSTVNTCMKFVDSLISQAKVDIDAKKEDQEKSNEEKGK